MRAHSVLIVGEHSLSRAFIRAWLAAQEGLSVAGEAEGCSAALAMVVKNRPCLVLVDLETTQSVDLDLVAKLKARFPRVKVILYFTYAHDNIAIKVMRAGAAGFVVKSAQGSEMENAIRTVLSGGIYLSPEFLPFVGSIERLRDAAGEPLSRRQAEILALIGQGLSTKSIAFELKISGKTVDVHKQALAKRLGLKRASELFKYAMSAGLGGA